MNIDINKIKNRLLVKYPFFGSVVANLDYIESRSCTDFNGNPTAATDGSTVYYHPDFINSITEEQQTFIFAHEVCHVAFDHIFRSEGKDPELWNIATDAVINALLKKDGLEMVKGGVDIPEAINYDAEEMYKKLLEDKQKKKQNNGQESNNNQNSNSSTTNKNSNNMNSDNSISSQNDNTTSKEKSNDNSNHNMDVGHDSHSMWSKAIENRKKKESQDSKKDDKPKEDKQDNSSKSDNDSSSNSKDKSSNTGKKKDSILDKIFGRNKTKEDNQNKKEDDQEQDADNNISKNKTNELDKKREAQEKKMQEQVKKISELGEKKSFDQNKIERRKQLEELREALAKQSRGAGTSTNSELRVIENIGTSTPLVDWRRLLKEAVKVEVDWSYKNAMIEEGVVTPHLEEIPQPETEILLDTSGSINASLLRNFLRECKNILGVSKLKVGCFDTKFYGFYEIKNEEDIDRMPFHGGGGTDFDTAVNAFSRRVENKIIFTDGEANMPSKKMDVIWIVFGQRKINPPGGKVIHISREQLSKLYFYTNDTQYRGKTRF